MKQPRPCCRFADRADRGRHQASANLRRRASDRCHDRAHTGAVRLITRTGASGLINTASADTRIRVGHRVHLNVACVVFVCVSRQSRCSVLSFFDHVPLNLILMLLSVEMFAARSTMVETENRLEPDAAPRSERPGVASAAQSVNPPSSPSVARAPAAIVTIVIASIVGLSMWYLMRAAAPPRPRRSRRDAHRHRGAGRRPGRQTSGRARRQCRRGPAPDRDRQSRTDDQTARDGRELAVAEADLAHIEAGTRAEDIAQRKRPQGKRRGAARPLPSRPTTASRSLPRAATRRCNGSTRPPTRSMSRQTRADQAKLAYEEAVAGADRRRSARSRARRSVKAQAVDRNDPRRRSTNSRSSRRSPPRSTRSARSSANMSRPARRCCRWSI